MTEHSPSVTGLIGIIALGAVGLGACVQAAVQTENWPVKLLAVVSAIAFGGIATYAASLPPESFGWLLVVSVSLLTFAGLLCIVTAGEKFPDRVRRAVGRLGRESEDGTDAKARAVIERAAIRVLTPLLLIAAIGGAIAITATIEDVPSLAFGSHVVFAGLLLLVFFYGTLLILLPLVRGLVFGEWPVELTTSGPRFSEREKEGLKEVGKELGILQREVGKSAIDTGRASLIALSSFDKLADLEKRLQTVEKKQQRLG